MTTFTQKCEFSVKISFCHFLVFMKKSFFEKCQKFSKSGPGRSNMSQKWLQIFLLLFFANWVILSQKKQKQKKNSPFSGPGGHIFGPFLDLLDQNWDFSRTNGFHQLLAYNWHLTFGKKSEKSHDPILRKLWKTSKKPIFDPFRPILPKMRFFSKNRFPSLFYIYDPLTSCKKAEKSYDPVPVTLRY